MITEASMATALTDTKWVPDYEREHFFHPKRKWRFDFAWPEQKVALEVEGSIYGRPVVCPTCKRKVVRVTKGGRPYTIREGGRHNSPKGFENDCDKYNSATLLGWKVFRVPTNFTVEKVLGILEGVFKGGA